MRSIKALGAAIMAVLAVGAVAASASAAEFHSTKEAALKGKALNSQVFVTKAGTVTCGKLTAEGTVPTGSSTTQEATVKYSECTVYGFIAVKISPALYLFMANETVDILMPITIETTGCVDTVPAQSGLGTIKYENNRGKLKILATVTGITSSGKGSTCEYAEEHEGTYNGNSEVEAAGSELSFS